MDATGCQSFDSGKNVLHITAKAIQLQHNQGIPCFHAISHLGELRTLEGRSTARDLFSKPALGLDFVSLLLEGKQLVVGRLLQRGYTTISEGAAHEDHPWYQLRWDHYLLVS
ncbi:hypothetical protein D9M69_665630 [compost metagenome]